MNPDHIATLNEIRQFKLIIPIVLYLSTVKTAYQRQLEGYFIAHEDTIKSAMSWLKEHKWVDAIPRKPGSRVKEDYVLTRNGMIVAKCFAECLTTVSKML